MIVLGLMMLSRLSSAGIFGSDDRTDLINASGTAQFLASSLPAMVQSRRLKELPSGEFEMSGTSLKEFGLCEDEAFYNEPSIATCSASLIGKNKILTAAHCFDSNTFSCENYKVVFDYKRPQIPFQANYILDKDQVYSCKKILHSIFDMEGEDLAIIELDRDVPDREPVPLNTSYRFKMGEDLIMIGYPLGISQKAVENGHVTKIMTNQKTFRHNLDTFSVNSGGPIFNLKGEQVGVLVRGTGPNLEKVSGRQCHRWALGVEDDFAEANDLSGLSKILSSF